MANKVAFVLGIRPDIVRAAPLLKILKEDPKIDLQFIWSGQHYSSNLKDDFLRELQCPIPDYELNIDVTSDISIVSTGIQQLGVLLKKIEPDVVLFLGDTNTVLLSIAASIEAIPVMHIEGCMRSFDLEMPEERNRRIIDHLASRIYAYLPRYKKLGIEEGIPEESIVVTGNLAVDSVNYFQDLSSWPEFLKKARLWRDSLGLDNEYGLMTCHRRENINTKEPLSNILKLAKTQNVKILFPASYATQRKLQEFELSTPENLFLCDPLEYGRFLPSLSEAEFVLTDSGTVVEEAAILGIPSIQMRRSTERPEVYDFGASIKFNPHDKFIETYPIKRRWQHELGGGNAAYLIHQDLKIWLESGERIDARTGMRESISKAWL